MNVPHAKTSLAFRPSAMRRWAVSSWGAVFAGLVIFLTAMAPSRLYAQPGPPPPPPAADQDLGQWIETDAPTDHGTFSGGQDAKRPKPGTTGEVYKRPDGELYIKTHINGDPPGFFGTITIPPRSLVIFKSATDPMDEAVQPATKPDSVPGQFDRDVDSLIRREIHLLTPQSPSVGTAFYSLALPSYLEALGNRAELWGSTSPFVSTNGVVGFEQGSSLLSILGSSTANGLTPELFQYNPETTGLSLSVIGSHEFVFASGSTYVPSFRGTYNEISGSSIPEPTSLIPMLGGMAGVGAWVVLRARALRKRLLVTAR
jgi:hypothetical protein